MASIESGAADNAQIWGGQERGCGGKITKKHLVAGAALAGCAVLGLGLFVGLSGKSSDSSEGSQIVGQAIEDPNSVGCFVDVRNNRVFTDRITDFALTPSICETHCSDGGYTYYALQWGKECWCAGASVDVDVNGVGECDYECAGDDTYICGGYLSYTVYEVGTKATTAVTPTDCGEGTLTVRFASSSGIAYFEGGGCATLTDMYVTQSGDGPLWVLDADDNVIDGGGGTPTGYWLLTMDLRVLDGVLLSIHGSSVGGDADVLRIESDGEDAFHEIRGHGGSLSFRSTKVTSWDTKNQVEQTTYEGGRSYINCVSEVMSDDDCDGAAKNDMGECRMDIIDSTMGNLGWFDAESYGLTWKVRGFCSDLSNEEVFDRTQVYGDIQGSDIYGMYYGMYSYGHQGGVWTNNKMHDNILYGFDPHDDSDDLTIADNIVYGNGNHGIIASKRCNNVEIYNNEVYDGGESAAGIFLHRSSDSAKVYNNYVHDMQDAGIAILESFDAEIYGNTFENVKYGIRISLGGARNDVHDNIFDTCSSYGLYTYMGSDAPDVSEDGRPSENIFTDNVISNTPTGVKLKEGDNNVFTGNDFTGSDTLEFDDSSNIEWVGNTLVGACAKGDLDFASGSDSIDAC